MLASHRLLLAAPVLVATLCGCGGWQAWRQRSHIEPMLSAAVDDPSYRIEPGQAAPDVFNEDYDPYNGDDDSNARQSGQFAPPPAPPAQSFEPPLDRDQQQTEAESADSNRTLIRTLRRSRIFSRDSVRGIYDRFRGSDSEPPPEEQIEREGPIAMWPSPLSPTQACSFNDTTGTIAGPVRLEMPETDQGPLRQRVASRWMDRAATHSPMVMQACPSSYWRPIYADPSDVCERVR